MSLGVEVLQFLYKLLWREDMISPVQYLIEVWVLCRLTICLIKLHAPQLLVKILDQLIFNEGPPSTGENHDLSWQVCSRDLLDFPSSAEVKVVLSLGQDGLVCHLLKNSFDLVYLLVPLIVL